MYLEDSFVGILFSYKTKVSIYFVWEHFSTKNENCIISFKIEFNLIRTFATVISEEIYIRRFDCNLTLPSGKNITKHMRRKLMESSRRYNFNLKAHLQHFESQKHK